jgi:hypothetical protein
MGEREVLVGKRHERAAYRRLFRDRAVRTHPTTSNGYKPAPDRDVNG